MDRLITNLPEGSTAELGAGAGATETHKYISDLLGKMTIDA